MFTGHKKLVKMLKKKKAELSVYTSSTALAGIPHSFSCPRIAALPLHLHAAP